MRTASELLPLLAALKAMHNELAALRKDIDELRDEVKVMERGGGIQFVLGDGAESTEDEESSSSDCDSVQSAPARIT